MFHIVPHYFILNSSTTHYKKGAATEHERPKDDVHVRGLKKPWSGSMF